MSGSCVWGESATAGKWVGMAASLRIHPLISKSQEDVDPLSKLPSDLARLVAWQSLS